MMPSDAVHLDGVEVSPSSPVPPLTQDPNMDESEASTMIPTDYPRNNADPIELVALQETGDDLKMNDEETHEARIERLGRQRPEKFKTLWAEIGFVFSIVMSQVMTVSIRFQFRQRDLSNLYYNLGTRHGLSAYERP
jgi:hypothetical protein